MRKTREWTISVNNSESWEINLYFNTTTRGDSYRANGCENEAVLCNFAVACTLQMIKKCRVHQGWDDETRGNFPINPQSVCRTVCRIFHLSKHRASLFWARHRARPSFMRRRRARPPSTAASFPFRQKSAGAPLKKAEHEHAFSLSEVKIVQRSRILRPALIFTTTREVM